MLVIGSTHHSLSAGLFARLAADGPERSPPEDGTVDELGLSLVQSFFRSVMCVRGESGLELVLQF